MWLLTPDFDEFADNIEASPSMFFYQGTFTDGAFNRIEVWNT